MTFEINKLSDNIGAEIVGLDLSKPITPEVIKKLKEAFYIYSVLLFRNQEITPNRHVSFSREFGELEIHVLKQFLLENHPEILVISNIKENGEAIGIGDAGQYWHTDLSYTKTPSRGSLLYARVVPRPDGQKTFGDTCFVSTKAAYKALPAHEK